jgi:hypothetical protein
MQASLDNSFSIPFHRFIAEICISLFFFASNSKFAQLLIAIYDAYPNRIQREFVSNGAIATFGTFLASSPLRQKTNLYKQRCAVTSRHRHKTPCTVGTASMPSAGDGGYFAPPTQTESKGNFCLITVYSHIALFQPQALRAKKQTFTNEDIKVPPHAVGRDLGWGLRRQKKASPNRLTFAFS